MKFLKKLFTKLLIGRASIKDIILKIAAFKNTSLKHKGFGSITFVIVLSFVCTLSIFLAQLNKDHGSFIREEKKLYLDDNLDMARSAFLINFYHAIDHYYTNYSKEIFEYELFDMSGSIRDSISTNFYRDVIGQAFYKKDHVGFDFFIQKKPSLEELIFMSENNIPMKYAHSRFQQNQVNNGYLDLYIVFSTNEKESISLPNFTFTRDKYIFKEEDFVATPYFRTSFYQLGSHRRGISMIRIYNPYYKYKLDENEKRKLTEKEIRDLVVFINKN